MQKDKLYIINRYPVRRIKGEWECICNGYKIFKNCSHIIHAKVKAFNEETSNKDN